MIKKITVIFTILLLTNGCSSIIHGTTDRVSVNSLEEGTTIFIDNAPRGRDFASVDVSRGDDHIIRATKKGCQDIVVPITDRFDATSLLGILIDFGIFSIPIDLISGAAWKISPKTYTVSPICALNDKLEPST
jgi:uncharacterized protein YceK